MVKKKKGEPMAPPADEPEPAIDELTGEPVPEGETIEAETEPAPAQGAPPAEEPPVPEEWAPSAKARVKEEAEKRRRVGTERDEWKAKAEELYAQLQAVPAAAPQPTEEDPLADVVDPQGLQRAKKQFWDMLQFAEENPDGADSVPIGRDANGNQILMDYSRKDIVKMKMTAQKVLNEGIPAKIKYLEQVSENVAAAKVDYPELLSEEANETNVLADQILRDFPEIKRSPQWILMLGDYIAGRAARLAKANGAPAPRTAGGKPLTKSQQAILTAPKFTPAPGVARTRAVDAAPQRARVVEELEKAKQAHIESGFSSETLERLIMMKRKANTRPTGDKTPVSR
jgi:hypothetical protein